MTSSANRHKRSAVLVAGVAVLVVGAVVAALSVRGDQLDPRAEFVAAANPLCEAETRRVAAVDPVGDEAASGELSAAANELSAAATELADAAATLPVHGDAVELQETIVEAARERVALYGDAAETGEVPTPEEIAATYERVGASFAAWAKTTCGDVVLPGAARIEAVAVAAAEAEAACNKAVEQMVEADSAAADGDIGADEYRAELAGIADDLAGAIDVAAEKTAKDPQGDWPAIARAVRDTAEALRDGDATEVTEASAAWAATASSEALQHCDGGLVASPQNPSGLLVAPVISIGITPTGAESGDVENAELFSQIAVERLAAMSGVDPGNSFGVLLAVEALGESFVAVPGDAPATTTGVSVAAPVTSSGGEPSAENPWVVRIVVADTSGRCAGARLFGFPALDGFESLGFTERCEADSVPAELPADR